MKKWLKVLAASLGLAMFMTTTISSVFAANSFTDMPSNEEFCSAIEWAVDPDGNEEYSDAITSGTSATTFSPRNSITRAQMVTFLYRAAGHPAVNELATFHDMPSNPTFQRAISWAASNGITSGYGNGLFGPNDTVTRGQMVTFLYRFNGSPAVSSDAAFTDVPATSSFKDAISWAASNGITAGYGNGLFGIKDACTRAQAVTFLYRDAKIYPDVFAVAAPASDIPEPTEESTEATTEEPIEETTEEPEEVTTEESTEVTTEEPTEVSTESPAEQPTEAPSDQLNLPPQCAPEDATYIGNIKSMKLHYLSCKEIKKMNESNKYYFDGTHEELVSLGFVPCKVCH